MNNKKQPFRLLSLVEKYGGTLKTITMGPPQAKEVVLESICMGADNGTVLTDRKFAGAVLPR